MNARLPIISDEISAWREFIGRARIQVQRLDQEPLRRLGAAVGLDPEQVATQPPPLAHWAYFLDVVGAGEIGEDGHPRRGGFMPPVSLPRRMFASAEVAFVAPLDLGADAECVTSIADVRHRVGSTGDLVLVDVKRVIRQEQRIRVIEDQTIVYRGHGGTEAVAPEAGLDGAHGWTPDRVDLFRFSAATFNSHRIHYDEAYASDVEGYPGLVVQGPFTAMKLAMAMAAANGPLVHFNFRAMAPLFASQPVRIRCENDTEGDIVASAFRCDGQKAMVATARALRQS